jgi:hypothetical protein
MGFRETTAEMETDYANITNAWAVHLMPSLCDAITFLGATYSSGLGTAFQTQRAISGGQSAPCAPYNTAYLVHKNTLAVGRRGNGRMFLPGVHESATSPAGFLDPAISNPIQTALNALFAAWKTQGFQPVLLHSPYTGNETPPSTIIEDIGLDAQVATQRNRMRR